MRVDINSLKEMCAGILSGSVTHVVANNTFQEMVENTVYPILSYSFAEANNMACRDGDMLIEIEHGKFHYSNFYAHKNVVRIYPIPLFESIQIKHVGILI